MNITTDLTKNDYKKLMLLAKEDLLKQKSHIPAILNIENKEIIGDMECNGIKLGDGGRTIDGKYVPPIMRFAFKIYFETDSVDLVRKLLDSSDVYVDNEKYYVCDYLYRTIENKMFNMRLISHDLFKEEDYEYNR